MAEILFLRNEPNARDLAPGEVLFREGDQGDVMFAVVDGTIDLTVGGTVVDHLGAGSIVGELAIVDGSPRSATAVAATSARVAILDRRRFTFLVQEHPTFALQVMEVMAARLRRANTSISG